MSQLKLKALFGGEKEIVEPPVRRKPGRPRKEREVRDPEEDETIAKVSHEVTQVLVRNDDVRNRDLPSSSTRDGRSRVEVTLGAEGRDELHAVCERTGEDPERFKPPGAQCARDETFGLSSKVRFLDWFEKRLKIVKDEELLLRVAARSMSRTVASLRSVRKREADLRKKLKMRGLSATGLSKSDAHKPGWAREAGRRCKGEAVRSSGAGRKVRLKFLYPLVREWFDDQRAHGFFVSPEDLVRRFDCVVRTYEEKANELVESGVALDEQETMRLAWSVEFVRKYENRIGRSFERYYAEQLMRACGAVLRTPQRLTKLSQMEEMMRWVSLVVIIAANRS